MCSDPRVDQLLEQLFETALTAEEVCQDHPELLPEVRRRLIEMRGVQADIDRLFPPSSELPKRNRAKVSVETFPEIPGYRVESILGRGGVGVVYKAYHLKLNRIVAIKMLLSGAYASSAELARFEREARAIASTDCSHIVQVYDIGEFEGRAFFTMEFVAGGSLAQKLGGVPQPAAQAASLVTTVAQAIGHAHKVGIVHRDLKPANILLSTDGEPKICDFGLASSSNADVGLTLSGAGIGTPSYMAPEQTRGRPGEMGPSVDVYALGAILYEMLTGRPPFRGENASETERQVLVQEPIAPSRLNSKVPRDLETICLKCLQKRPSARYATADELAADLDRCLSGAPIVARPVGTAERVVKWARRHPTFASLVVTLMLTLTAAITVGVRIQRQENARRFEITLRENRAQEAIKSAFSLVAELRLHERWIEAITSSLSIQTSFQLLKPRSKADDGIQRSFLQFSVFESLSHLHHHRNA